MPATITTAIIGAAGIAAGTTAATLIGVGVSAVFAVGLTFAQQLIFGSDVPNVDAGPLNEGSRQTTRQSTPRQRLGYGTVTAAGAQIFVDKNPPNLVIQYALAARESNALKSVFTQGSQVFFDANGNATSTPFFDGLDVFLQVSVRLGHADQARDPLLFDQFPTISSSFRQRGHTVATVRFFYGNDRDQHEEKWGQESNIHPKFQMELAKVYDPRDPLQDVDDDSTWGFTDNTVLCICDYIRLEDGGRKSAAAIDWDYVKGAADICDQMVELKDGSTEKRYTVNGIFDTAKNPAQILRELLGAMRGRIVWVDGKLRPMPGAVQFPEMTITEDMLAGPFDFRGFAPRAELVNVINSKFYAQERDNQLADTPVLERADLIATDSQRIQQSLNHPFIDRHTKAQRLDKAFLEQSRLGRSLAITTDMRAFRVTAGDVVNIELRNFTYANGQYIIERMEFVSNFSQLKISLREFSNRIYEWDPQTDERDFVLQEAA